MAYEREDGPIGTRWQDEALASLHEQVQRLNHIQGAAHFTDRKHKKNPVPARSTTPVRMRSSEKRTGRTGTIPKKISSTPDRWKRSAVTRRRPRPVATITSMAFRINSFYNGEGMRQARQDIARLDSSMNALTKSSKALMPNMRDVIALALSLGPALVPIAGGLLGIGAAASSAFVSAGAAIGIYAVALKGAISSTVGQGSAVGSTAAKLATAQKALDNTTKGTKEYTKAVEKVTQAEKAHEAAIAALPPVQEKFARAYDNAKVAILDFNTANAKFTLGPATTMLEAFMALLPKMSPVLAAIQPVMQKVADATKAWVTDGGLDRFLRFVIKYGVPALDGFMNSLRSMFGALGKGMRDTAPLGAAFVQWLQNTMAAFKGWAEGGGFQRFLQWVQENKGQLIDALKNLGTFLANIGKAIAGLNGNAFQVLGVFFQVLASFPVGVLQAMMYAFIGITLALKIYAVVAFISAAATTAMTLAATPFGILLFGMALTIAGVIAALIALGVGIYFLIKYWDEVSAFFVKTWDATWGWLKRMWSALWEGIKDAAVAVWDFLTNGWGQTLLLFMGPIGLIIAVAANWEKIWGWIRLAATTVWDALKLAWDVTTRWISDKFFAVIGPIMETWNTVWPEMQKAAENVWNVLKAAWSILWAGMKIVWDVFWALFGPSIKAAWEGMTATASAAWDLLKAGWKLVWSIIQGVYQTAWAILSGAWSIGWTFLTETAKIAWSILTGAWKVIWSVVTGIWNTFYATFSAIFKAAWDVIVSIATGIWNVIKAVWDALWKTVTAIFMTFLAIFTGNWSGAWNAIKDAAMAIWNVIKTAWQSFLNVIKTALDGFISIIKAAWNAFWTAIQNTATTFWNALRNTFQTFLTAVQNLWNTVWNAVKTIFQTVVNAIMTIAQNWWSTFRAALNTFLEFIKGLWNTAWTTIRTLFTAAVNGLITTATGLWTQIRSIFSTGSTWLLNTFWNPVKNFFTKTIPDAFDAGVKALGTAWAKLKKLVRDPIQAVVNVVYNNGIVKLWNAVAGVFGADKLKEFTLPAFKEGGPTGNGSSNGFLARVHPGEHVWTRREVQGAGGHEAVAEMRRRAMNGARVRKYGEHSFADGGGIFGTGLGPNVGPDLVPDGIIKDIGGAIGGAVNKLKSMALGAISGPFGAAVDAVAQAGKATVRGLIPGSNTGMEQLGVGIIDKVAKTIKDWVKQNDVAPEIGGNGFVPWKSWQSGDGTHVNYGGVTVNRRTAAMLKNASNIARTTFSMFQGSYSNSVGASAGTHSGGGAADLGPAKDAIVGAMRASGFAAWRRTQAEGFSPHIHGIAVGDPTVSAAAAAQVRAFQAGKNGLANNGPDTYTGGGTSGKSVSAAKSTGRAMLSNYGWASHWSALEALWNRESGWRWNADNPTSDAYGIPQALPGSKMKSAGADWKTNPATQIKWGLSYIKSRYGTPTKANNFQKANNWYGYGTRSATPGWGVVGDRGIELMKMRGGEDIRPLESLVSDHSGGGVNLTLHIDARGATAAAVQRLETTLPDKLRMALEQGTGRRP